MTPAFLLYDIIEHYLDKTMKMLERFGPIEVFEGWGSTEANTALINVDNYVGSCGRVPDWNRVRYELFTTGRPESPATAEGRAPSIPATATMIRAARSCASAASKR